MLAAALGLSAGAAGTFAGHLGVLGAHRLDAGANAWLQGAHGPPFFDLTLAAGVFYAALGAVLCPGRRLAAALAGLGVSFAACAGPMAVATRAFSWGEDPGSPETLAWFYLVLGAYAASNLGAAAAVGRLRDATVGGRRTALGAVLGASAAYLLQFTARRFLPGFGDAVEVIGILPPPSALYSGILWGAAIGAGVEGMRG